MKIYTNRIRVQATGEEYDVKDINFELKHVFPHDRSLEFPFDEVRFLTPHKVKHTIAIGDKIDGREVIAFDNNGVCLEGRYRFTNEIRPEDHETGVAQDFECCKGENTVCNLCADKYFKKFKHKIEKIDLPKGNYQADYYNVVEKLNEIIDYINNK